MQVHCKLTEVEVRKAIVDYLAIRSGVLVNPSDIVILVKSAQNYKSEWEIADFKAEFDATIKRDTD